MDSIYEKSIPLLVHVQTSLAEYEYIFNAVNQIADPSYTISIIFPIICTFNTLLAADILMVTVIAEWSNTIIKWLVREDRPFWWVREVIPKKYAYRFLKQGPLTCETSPGSPSGHLMSFAAVFFVIISACIRHYCNKNSSTGDPRSSNTNKSLKIVFWSIYLYGVIIVAVARMYVATHFPHQCLIGAIIGFLIGYYFGSSYNKPTIYWHNATKLQLLSWVILATGISFATYWTQKALGIDPQWSVKMAFKWCQHIENVHVSTTPLYSLVRDTGLGVGLASVSPVIQKASNKHNLMVSVACVLFFCTGLHLAQSSVPTDDAIIFYMFHAILYVTLPYVLLDILPKVATVKRKLM